MRIIYLSFYHFCRRRKKNGSHLQQQTLVLYWPQLLSRPLHCRKEVQCTLNMWQLEILSHTGTFHPAKKKIKNVYKCINQIKKHTSIFFINHQYLNSGFRVFFFPSSSFLKCLSLLPLLEEKSRLPNPNISMFHQ